MDNDALDREQEARIALLQHFSSKSSNQTANALTLSLVFLAFVGSLDIFGKVLGNWQIGISFLLSRLLFSIFCAVSITSFLLFGIHTIYRLIYWGYLADAISAVEMRSSEKILESFSEDVIKNSEFHKRLKEQQLYSVMESSSDLTSAYLLGLSDASSGWAYTKMLSRRFSRILITINIHLKMIFIVSLASLFVVFLLYFLVP